MHPPFLPRFGVFCAWLLFVCSGCHIQRVPFNRALQTRHAIDAQQLTKLQFYLSHDIVLRRSSTRKTNQVHTGRLRLHREETTTEIIIPKGTAGILTRAKDGLLGLSFAKNTVLNFEQRRENTLPSPKPQVFRQRGEPRFARGPDVIQPADSTRYVSSSDAERGYFLRVRHVDGAAEVDFAGESWTVHGEGLLAHLLIDTETLSDLKIERHHLDGRHLSKQK